MREKTASKVMSASLYQPSIVIRNKNPDYAVSFRRFDYCAISHLGNAVQCCRTVDDVEILGMLVNDRFELLYCLRVRQLLVDLQVVHWHEAFGTFEVLEGVSIVYSALFAVMFFSRKCWLGHVGSATSLDASTTLPFYEANDNFIH
jgi:hypothetical protein